MEWKIERETWREEEGEQGQKGKAQVGDIKNLRVQEAKLGE